MGECSFGTKHRTDLSSKKERGQRTQGTEASAQDAVPRQQLPRHLQDCSQVVHLGAGISPMHLKDDAQCAVVGGGVAPCTHRIQLALPAIGRGGKLPVDLNGVQRDGCI